MNEAVTSLDRLHDIVLPPTVPWWPLAPGWYAVFLVVLLLVLFLVHRAWRRYRANAYRRAALRELTEASDAAAIAELLRRTALAIAPREEVAGMTGTTWLDWLNLQSPKTTPGAVPEQLVAGVYGRSVADLDLSALRDYAAWWIRSHRLSRC